MVSEETYIYALGTQIHPPTHPPINSVRFLCFPKLLRLLKIIQDVKGSGCGKSAPIEIASRAMSLFKEFFEGITHLSCPRIFTPSSTKQAAYESGNILHRSELEQIEASFPYTRRNGVALHRRRF
jgi:hypothetical protein